MNPPVLPDVTSSPILVYAALIIALLVLIASAFPKIFGPISETIKKMTDSRRRTAEEAEDADREDIDRQLAYLKKAAQERLDELIERDRLLTAHAKWDRKMEINHPDHEAGDPPPLWPQKSIKADNEAS